MTWWKKNEKKITLVIFLCLSLLDRIQRVAYGVQNIESYVDRIPEFVDKAIEETDSRFDAFLSQTS